MTVAVLISGRGSNLAALLAARIPVCVVVSNVPGAAGLQVAARHGVPAHVVPHGAYDGRESFEKALARIIDPHAPRYVALAGFMRILSPWFVERYAGRILNIHPSLLPAFPGLDTHARALAAGVKVHGATVHLVTAQLDHGPIVMQAALPVRFDDDAESLAARVLVLEHQIYPQALRWALEDRLIVEEGRVRVRSGDAQLLYSDRV